MPAATSCRRSRRPESGAGCIREDTMSVGGTAKGTVDGDDFAKTFLGGACG